MTNLFDQTIQHTGWAGPNFVSGGWIDLVSPIVSGLNARSYWAQSLNGALIDQAVHFTNAANTEDNPNWFNVHTNSVLQGLTIPSPAVITPDRRLWVFTRTPSSSGVILFRIAVSDQGATPAPSTPPCQFGTQPQGSAPSAVTITTSLLEQIVSAIGHATLATVMAAVVGTTLGVTDLCSAGPPVFPLLNGNPSVNSLPDLVVALRSVAWPYFCQCTPGAPNPIDFPLPVVRVDGPIPLPTTYFCDPNDMCNNIVAILKQIGQLQATLASDYALTTLMQRYHVPFAAIPGAQHSGLTGSGQFPVSRLLGVGLAITSDSDTTISLPGVPTYLKNQGWIGISTPGGMLAERRLARAAEIWLPTQMPAALLFGWNLESGVTLDVRELQAEP